MIIVNKGYKNMKSISIAPNVRLEKILKMSWYDLFNAVISKIEITRQNGNRYHCKFGFAHNVFMTFNEGLHY